MDVSIVSGDLGVYLQGLKNTLVLVSISFSIGLIMAVPLAVLRTSGHIVVHLLIRIFVDACRVTPLLVQMFFLYYCFGNIEGMKETFLWPMFKEAYFCALFVFCLNTCAYTTEILTGAIVALAQGEIEAARAAGMSTMRLLRRIVLPVVFRRISTYSKEIVFMLHGFVLTSVITIFDITGAGRIVNSLYYSPYEALFSSAILYLIMTLSLIVLVRTLKKRWHRPLLPLNDSITELEAST
ncbi:MAG TPA: amino acid ABC transporter permease [Desulfobulbaceae bacterium]|nr:amino acid ABC transporter permease [Desulfobulbaceae bacterium]